MKKECQFATLVGDGYCQDYVNNFHCAFDNDDCCGSCINTEYCEKCECLKKIDENVISNKLVGDGFCHDSTNNVDCNFDGGDCCGSCVNKKYCSECQCLGDHFGEKGIKNQYLADGFCQDETNNAHCDFDGFDCCGGHNINTDYCSDCECQGTHKSIFKWDC